MVRRGSTVRVRERASLNEAVSAASPSSSTESDPAPACSPRISLPRGSRPRRRDRQRDANTYRASCSADCPSGAQLRPPRSQPRLVELAPCRRCPRCGQPLARRHGVSPLPSCSIHARLAARATQPVLTWHHSACDPGLPLSRKSSQTHGLGSGRTAKSRFTTRKARHLDAPRMWPVTRPALIRSRMVKRKFAGFASRRSESASRAGRSRKRLTSSPKLIRFRAILIASSALYLLSRKRTFRGGLGVRTVRVTPKGSETGRFGALRLDG